MTAIVVRLPIMIQDPITPAHRSSPRLVELVDIFDSHFTDGPASHRVRIKDVDPLTGVETTGVALLAPTPPDTWSRYHKHEVNDPTFDIFASDFIRTSAFGTVYRTLQLFEAADALNRPLLWASGDNTLMVFTRAGRKRNAEYQRNETALKFFFFESSESGRDILTALSRDIVAHEAGHAMLDAVAPGLLESHQPDARALHESVADLAALLLSFQSTLLVRSVLQKSNGSINEPTAFSNIAEEFGSTDPASNVHALRSLVNDNRYDEVDRLNVHVLSTVLSGALYTMLRSMYTDKLNRLLESRSDDRLELCVEALQRAGDKFRRMFFRALDYLPAGGVTFADVGRAILAADQSLYPEQPRFRAVLRNELIWRRVTPNDNALTVTTNYNHSALDGVNIFALLDSETATRFVEKNRSWLQVPPETGFTATTLQVSREVPDEPALRIEEEVILRVRWDIPALTPSGVRTVGTTLVLDPNRKQVRALLSNSPQVRTAAALARETEDIEAFVAELEKAQAQGKVDSVGIYSACIM